MTKFRTFLLASLVLLLGCDVVDVTGPRNLPIGEIGRFEIVYEVNAEPFPISDGVPIIAGLIPDDWTVEQAFYYGERVGHGTPEILETNPSRCDFGGPPTEGFQYVYFYGPNRSFQKGDRGTMTVDFRVHRPGDYELTFWGAGSFICGDSRSITTTVFDVEVPAASSGGLTLLAILLGLVGIIRLNSALEQPS